MTQDQNWPFRPMTQDQNQTSTDADTCTSPRSEDDLRDDQTRELRDLYGPGTGVESSCNRALAGVAGPNEHRLLAEIYKLNKDLENEAINLRMELDTTRRALGLERAEICKLNKELENESVNRHMEIARLADDLEKERAENARLRAALVTAEQQAKKEHAENARLRTDIAIVRRLRNEIADVRDQAVRDLEHEKAAAAHLVRERDALLAKHQVSREDAIEFGLPGFPGWTDIRERIQEILRERDAALAEQGNAVVRALEERNEARNERDAAIAELEQVRTQLAGFTQATATEGAIYRAIRAEIASAFRALAKVSGRAVIGMDLSKVAAELEAK